MKSLCFASALIEMKLAMVKMREVFSVKMATVLTGNLTRLMPMECHFNSRWTVATRTTMVSNMTKESTNRMVKCDQSIIKQKQKLITLFKTL